MGNKEGIVVEQDSDFEALDYLESERSEAEFAKDLETLLLEYLQKPSRYTAILGADRKLCDHNGLSLVEMGEKAEEKYHASVRFERIHAETDGLRGLEDFYNVMSSKDVVVLMMPPGTKEEGFGNVSMTNISIVSGEGKNTVVTTYTIPTRNLSITEHRKIVQNATKDAEVVTMPPDERTREDLILSSHPMLIKDGVEKGVLDLLADGFGFDNFESLNIEVDKALEVKDDPVAESRRKGLLVYLAMQIVSFRNKRNRNGLLALGRTVRSVFALEAAGQFSKLDSMEMIAKFKGYMHGFMYKQELDKSYPASMDMGIMANEPRIRELWELHRLIEASPYAKEKLEGGSCGGGGWEDMFNSKYGGDMTDLRNPSIMQDILGKSESSKEESYDFDHEGKCVVCKGDPKKLGPCQICEDCDRKIRAQVE